MMNTFNLWGGWAHVATELQQANREDPRRLSQWFVMAIFQAAEQ